MKKIKALLSYLFGRRHGAGVCTANVVLRELIARRSATSTTMCASDLIGFIGIGSAVIFSGAPPPTRYSTECGCKMVVFFDLDLRIGKDNIGNKFIYLKASSPGITLSDGKMGWMRLYGPNDSMDFKVVKCFNKKDRACQLCVSCLEIQMDTVMTLDRLSIPQR